MPFDTLQQELAAAVDAREKSARRWHGLKARANRLEDDIALLERRGEKAAVAALQAEREQVTAHLDETRQELVTSARAIADLTARWELQVDLETSFTRLESTLPIALFPVRLEVCYERKASRATALLIRVYPDETQIETHETALTFEEAEAVEAYRQAWHDVADEDARETARRQAWRTLAERFGPRRAAWLVGTASTLVGSELEIPVPPALREDVWTRAPEVRVLPDRWLFLGFRRDEEIFRQEGRMIPDPLPAGPIPSGYRPEDEDPETVPSWVTDFAAAEGVGMAARVELEGGVEPDFVMVLGIKTTLDAEASATRLAELLDGHRYTEGLAFVRQGTPSNNSTRQAAGFRDAEPDSESFYQATFGQAPCDVEDAQDQTNGALTARALGLVTPQLAEPLARAEHADLCEQRHAAAMNRVLWPATLKYFLLQMLPPYQTLPRSPELAHDDLWRCHFREHVRGRGPLPLLRIGHQPLGLLPVTSLDHWKPWSDEIFYIDQVTFDQLALPYLKTLRKHFLTIAAQDVPRLEAGQPENLLRILNNQAISPTIAARPAMGPAFQEALDRFLGQADAAGLEAVREKLSALDAELLHELGITEPPYAGRLTFHDQAYLLNGPRICSEPLSEDEPGEDNGLPGLSWLLEATLKEILAESDPPAGANTLLYLLLRHAVLWEHGYALYDTLKLDQELAEPTDPGESGLLILHREIEHRSITQPIIQEETITEVLFDPDVTERFLWLLEYWPGKELPPGTTPGDILIELTRDISPDGSPRPLVPPPAAPGRRDSGDPQSTDGLDRLGEFWRDLEHLQTVPTAELDRLLGETLDLCSHRLDAWITSLASERLWQLRRPEQRPGGIHLGGYGWLELPPGAGAAPPSRGFVHAPSLDQATLAAILEAHPEARDLTQARLSSKQVQGALGLAEEVSQGLALDEALGYRFERDLHDRGLDSFVKPLRQLAAIDATANELSADMTPLGQVVNGWTLLELWRDGPFPWDDLLEPDDPRRAELEKAFERLDQQVNDLEDLLLAESLFHWVKGNTDRVNASLETARSGKLSPELACVRTPRSGIAVVHRLLMILPAATAPATSPRAQAAPGLNAWLRGILPPPGEVRVRIGGEPYRLAELGLGELEGVDALVLAAGDGRELRRRIRLAARDAFPELDPLDLELDRDPAWPTALISGEAWLTTVQVVADLIAEARPLQPTDLDLPTAPVGGDVDEAELQQRAARAVKQLVAWCRQAQQVLAEEPANAASIRPLLIAAAGFLESGALPEDTVELDELRTQLQTVYNRLRLRLDTLSDASSRGTAVEADAAARLKIVFGETFPVLPPLRMKNGPELQTAFSNSPHLQQNDQEAAGRWLSQAARVRQGAARLRDALCLTDILRPGTRQGLQVGQLPVVENEPWVALATSPEREHQAGRVSLVAHLPKDFDAGHPVAGLLLDEWVETIPAARETTGVAFHLPRPANEAPRALLLAVSPDPTQPWTVDKLQAVLHETFDLTRIRAVGPEHLGSLGQALPALYFVSSSRERKDVAVTDFLRNATAEA